MPLMAGNRCWSHLEPLTLLPEQLDVRRTASARSPALRMVVAMFEDAVRCVLRHPDGPVLREYEEAQAWFLSDEREWPFAFLNVCQLLGLDASAVRNSLPLRRRPRVGSLR